MSKYGLKFEQKSEACVDAAKTHHHFLTEDTSKSFQRSPNKHHNLLIEGENYHALRALNYTHAGKVDVIYIDPPYNTGNKDFVYNDSFVDNEDSFRHSKWLSFMDRRLRLAHSLLSECGVIFISIDDNEFAQLKLLCDSVFGELNFMATFIWETKKAAAGVPPTNLLVINNEYVLCYCKNKSAGFRFRGDSRPDDIYKQDKDGRKWTSESITASGHQDNHFDIVDPVTGNSYYNNWAFSFETIISMIGDGKILFPAKKNGVPRQKKYVDTYTNETKAITTSLGWVSNQDATKDMKDLFGGERLFDHPKPLPLIKRILQQATKDNSIVLDFFAGSGTTGQAVAELNKEDGGTRQFILVTNNDKSEKLPQGICTQVTYPRLEKTIGDENLKFFQLTSMPKANSKVASIEQLELHTRLIPTFCVLNNTFQLVEKTSHSFVFTNHTKDAYIGVWSNTNGKQKPVDQVGLASFQKKLQAYPNSQLLVNRPRRGYAADYFNFMSELHV